MADIREMRMFTGEQLSVPQQLPKILKELSIEVIKYKPSDVNKFAREYFERRLKECNLPIPSLDAMESPSSQNKVILLTGLTGYVGTQIAKQLLQKLPTGWRLKGSVRNKTNLDKLKTFINEIGQENFKRIELVEMDLNDPASIINALGGGVTDVLHVASPINPSDFTKYEDFVNPVITGTKAIIQGCKVHKIQKLVVTSSCLCLIGQLPREGEYDERDFAELNGKVGYIDSKIHEEILLKDFYETQINTEVVIINAGFIVGPPILNTSFSSIQLIGSILTGKMPALANFKLPIVDVRDVAEAHIKALFEDDLHGERIALCHSTMSLPEVAQILQKNFQQYGYPVTTTVATDPSKLPEMNRAMVNKNYTINNMKSRQLLGMKYKISVEQSIVDMIRDSAKYGIIENKLSK